MGPRLVRRITSGASRRRKRAEPPRSPWEGTASLVVAVALIAVTVVWARGVAWAPRALSAALHAAHPHLAQSPAPRGVLVSAVRPRPGVPPALAARDWLAEVADTSAGSDGGSVWQAGTMGTTARLMLPPGERGLAVGAGLVASASTSPSGSTMRVRDIATGGLRRSVQTTGIVDRGALIGRLLLWSGWADAKRTTDLGVVALDLTDATSNPQVMVAGGLDLRPFGPEAGRGPFHASATGDTVVSSVGAGASTRVDVIDVATRTPVARLANEIVLAITGDAGIVLRPDGIAKVELRSGAVDWEKSLDRVVAVLANPGRVVVAFDRGDQYVVAAIGDDGAMRDLNVQSGLARGHVRYLATDLSAPDQLVLLPEIELGAALATHPTASAVVLDPTTGQIGKTAFGIGAP